MAEARKAGFGGGIVVDYPESKKARKYYLCLVAGSTSTSMFPAPEGISGKPERLTKRQRLEKRKEETRKDFIARKKELYRKRGKEGVPHDSKYSGRKRRGHF